MNKNGLKAESNSDKRTLSREKVIGALPRYLNAAGASWAILGDTTTFPRVDSDIDIAFDPKSIARFGRALDNWSRDHGLQLVQVFQHEISAWYFIYASVGDDGLFFIHPDICTNYMRNNKFYIDVKKLLEDRICVTHKESGTTWYEPVAHMQLTYYLMKRLGKGSLDECHAELLRDWFNHNSCKSEESIRTQLDKRIIPILKGHYSNAECAQRLLSLRNTLAIGRSPGLKSELADLYRKWIRYCHPTGLIICSPQRASIARTIAERWAPAFRRVTVATEEDNLHMVPLADLRRSTLICSDTPHLSASSLILSNDDMMSQAKIDLAIATFLNARVQTFMPLWSVV